MKDFIYESSEDLKKRLLFIAGLLIIVFLGTIMFVLTPESINSLKNLSSTLHSTKITPVKMFLLSSLGGLFFIPIPLELLFTYGLSNKAPAFNLMAATIIGLVIGHFLSYIIGLYLSKFFRLIISAKKMFTMRRYVSRYGSMAVLLASLIPAPTPIMAFALGIVRYSITRLFTLLIIGNVIKYVIIIYAYNFLQ